MSSAQDEVVIDIVVDPSVNAMALLKVLLPEAPQVRSHPAAHSHLFSGVLGRNSGFRKEKSVGEDEVVFGELLHKGPVKWQLDRAVAVEICAYVDEPAELEATI